MNKIMVVDDEPDQIVTLQYLFKSHENEYELLGANSGEECLQLLEEGEKPDLILLDIMMPGMSGWEVFDALQDNPDWNDIPIVFLTARTDDLAEDAGSFLGEDYIEKPFEIEELLKRVDAILEKKNT